MHNQETLAQKLQTLDKGKRVFFSHAQFQEFKSIFGVTNYRIRQDYDKNGYWVTKI